MSAPVAFRTFVVFVAMKADKWSVDEWEASEASWPAAPAHRHQSEQWGGSSGQWHESDQWGYTDCSTAAPAQNELDVVPMAETGALAFYAW